jgi:hypothetical protein
MNVERGGISHYLALLLIAVCALAIALDRIVDWPLMHLVTNQLYQGTVVLGAVALLLGVVNVASVHLRSVLVGQQGWYHSLALVITLLAVLVTGLLSPIGVASPLVEWFYDALIAPGQATLFALLAFFMAAAAFRYLRFGSAGGIWMLAGALLILGVQTPAIGAVLPPAVTAFAVWTIDVPGMATLRGALLGSSLALAVAGLRFILTKK